MSAKAVYKLAYHNARCVRNLDPRAKLHKLPRRADGSNDPRVCAISEAANVSRIDYAQSLANFAS